MQSTSLLAFAALASLAVATPAAASRVTYSGTEAGGQGGVFIPFSDGPFFDRSRNYMILVKVSRPALRLSAKLSVDIAFGTYEDDVFFGDSYTSTLVNAESSGSTITRARFWVPESFDTVYLDENDLLQGSFEYSAIVPDYLDWEFATPDPVDYRITIFATDVPEASTWAMLIAGFGLTGAVMRRRRSAGAPECTTGAARYES